MPTKTYEWFWSKMDALTKARNLTPLTPQDKVIQMYKEMSKNMERK